MTTGRTKSAKEEKMKDRNTLKCPKCGFEVWTEANSRECAKCNNRMEFVCKESVYRNKK